MANICVILNSLYLYKAVEKASLAAMGAIAAPPGTLHHLLNPLWPAGGPKIANKVGKGVYPRFLAAPFNFH